MSSILGYTAALEGYTGLGKTRAIEINFSMNHASGRAVQNLTICNFYQTDSLGMHKVIAHNNDKMSKTKDTCLLNNVFTIQEMVLMFYTYSGH